MFEFISAYQGEFHYRKIGDSSGKRYRLFANQGNRLTVGFAEPTREELAEFQTWQRQRHEADQLAMLADPRKYSRKFWEVKPEPDLIARI